MPALVDDLLCRVGGRLVDLPLLVADSLLGLLQFGLLVLQL